MSKKKPKPDELTPGLELFLRVRSYPGTAHFVYVWLLERRGAIVHDHLWGSSTTDSAERLITEMQRRGFPIERETAPYELPPPEPAPAPPAGDPL